MEGVESVLGYYPKCPHCGATDVLNVTPCPHTQGLGGFIELVSCSSCETLITTMYPPQRAFDD